MGFLKSVNGNPSKPVARRLAEKIINFVIFQRKNIP